MNKIMSSFLIIMVSVVTIFGWILPVEAFNQKNTPALTVTIDQNTVHLSWTAVEGATKYALAYQDKNDITSPWYYAELGNINSISFDLWPGAAYIAAIHAGNDLGYGEPSKIQAIEIPTSPLITIDPVPSDANGSQNYFMPIKTGNYVKFKITSNNNIFYGTYQIVEVGNNYYIEKFSTSLDADYTLTKYVLENNQWKLSRIESYSSGINSTILTYSPYVNFGLPLTIEIGHTDVQNFTMTNTSVHNNLQTTSDHQQTLAIKKIETITVPAGTFETVKIYTQTSTITSLYSANSESDSWYAKGIGLVKFQPDQDHYYLAELYSYYFQ